MTGMLIETLGAAVVLIPWALILGKLRRYSMRQTLAFIILTMYFAGIYLLTGLPTLQFHTWNVHLQLLPFFGILSDAKNAALNMILFVPLGFLLPFYWSRYRRFSKTVIFGFLLSLSVELLQLFTYRATDVNDLITNTAGTLMGYLLFHALKRKFVMMPMINPIPLRAILTTSSFVMFFLQPYIVSGTYEMLL